MNPKGIYAAVGGSRGAILKALFLGPLISIFGSKKMGLLIWKQNNKEDMAFIGELFEAGKVIPVIDRRYQLSEVAEAFRYLEEGHHQGKIVITVENNNKS